MAGRPGPGTTIARRAAARVAVALLALLASCRDAAPRREIALRDGPVVLDQAHLLYAVDFRGRDLPEGWTVETGSWKATPEGLEGRIDAERAAVIWCDRTFPADVAVRYWAEAIPPHTTDANAFFRASGRIYGTGDTTAWIAGIAGWHRFEDGLEKNPSGPSWRVPGEPLAAGTTVEVIAGGRGAQLFLWKDGKVRVEGEDTAQAVPGQVGLGTWNSAIRFVRLCVYRVGS
jgi:hypothetical protein